MGRQDIEFWALRLIDLVKASRPKEDDYAELKGEWIEAKKAARQIAGHANSARGEPILWLMGVDERRGVLGVSAKEMSNWWAGVSARFDGYPPSMTHVNMLVDNCAVVALLFDTGGAPYVIKSEDGSGQIQREVPWREGNSTRSVYRNDLLRILVPLQRKPEIEVLEANLTLNKDNSMAKAASMYLWYFDANLYLVPRSRERIVIPRHRCTVTLFLDDVAVLMNLFALKGPMRSRQTVAGSQYVLRFGGPEEPASFTILSTSTEVLVDGPGTVRLQASTLAESSDVLTEMKCVHIDLTPIDISTPVSFDIVLRRTANTRNGDVAAYSLWNPEADDSHGKYAQSR